VRERDPETGKTKQVWRGGFPTREAARKERDRLRNANRGTAVSSSKMTLGQYLEQWLRGHEVSLKPSTVRSYRGNLDRYLLPAIGGERLQDLSPSRLSAVFRDLYEHGGQGGRPLSPRTVEFARAVLRRALQDAVLERLIEVNPVVGTKRPRSVKPKHQTWTAEELRTFIGSLPADHRWTALWELAAGTGMRRGEILALRWSDVDLDNGLLRVDRSVFQSGTSRSYGLPKNHERREVVLDPHLTATLRGWRKIRLAERMALGADHRDDEDLVFTWQDGRPVPPDYVTRIFRNLTTAAAVPRLNFHSLRHSHATLLLREGVPVHIVARRLGHRDASVTLNTYADAIPNDDNRAAQSFTKAVWGA
jgi:integrase